MVVASVVIFAMSPSAWAQIYSGPMYSAPAGVRSSPDMTPGYKGYAAPGNQWREQRATGDWRNNTWRERTEQEDWRNNNWRTQRANEDWRQREDYAKDRTKNNAADRGYVECGVGSVGSSASCRNYAKEKAKREPAAADRGVAECGPNSVVESCRSRRQDDDAEAPAPVKQQAHGAESDSGKQK